MLRIRRLYFYLVLYASLSMVLVGLATLGRVLLEQLFGATSSGVGFGLFGGREQFREQTALGIALTVIGLPVWLVHWRAVGDWLSGPNGEDEQGSGLRRLYLYAVLLTCALTVFVAARDLLEHLFGLPLGLSRGIEQVLGLSRPLPYLLVAGLLWLYHWRIAAADRALVGERGASATLRRWYVYLLTVFGALPLMINLTTLGQQLWVVLFDRGAPIAALGPSATARTVSASGATIVVALAFWLGYRAWSERAAARSIWHGESERHSVLRKVYLYGLVLGTVGWLLVNATQVLRFGLANLLGVAPETIGNQPILVALGQPLVSMLVYVLFWAFYWRAVRDEAHPETEAGRQAGVRRIYYYLVSGVSLAFLAGSVVGLLQLVADLLLGGTPIDVDTPRATLALQTSRLLVALPVWLFHWSAIQKVVQGDAGAAEMRATSRRWYLYIVDFVAVVALLVGAAQLVYQLMMVALGEPFGQAEQLQIAHLLATVLVAAMLLWYHWWLVLRADLAVLRQAGLGRAAVAVVTGLEPASVERLERFVAESLEGARVKLYWTDEAHVRETVERVTQAAGESSRPDPAARPSPRL